LVRADILQHYSVSAYNASFSQMHAAQHDRTWIERYVITHGGVGNSIA
jgi:hypothetical protein